MTDQQRQARIDEVLRLLGISHTRNVIIGNTRRKGISGGERKRVSVAMELLNRPKLIFLDEPTSGLDSSTALSVCEALKNLTIVGECTVVTTIHQPQPKIFALFDNLMLMKQGNLVYQGSARRVDLYLEQLGFPLPADMSMADHLLDVISPHNEFGEVITEEATKHVVPVNLSLGMDKHAFVIIGKRNWFSQFRILAERNFQQYFRNKDIIFMNFAVTILLAVFVGRGLWYQIGTGQDSIPKRVPSLFFTCVTQGIVGSLVSINSFPSERAIMLRERQAGTYQVSSYFLAKTFVDILTQTWPPILFSCVVYFMIGYQPLVSKFFYYAFFMVLDSWTATSVATAVTCICVSVELSSIVLAFTFEICRLFGGFFASPTQIHAIPRWRFIDALCYVKYVFVGIAINELTGLELSCDNPSGCAITRGSQIMIANGYDQYTIGFCIGILFVLIVGTRFIAYLALRFIKI
jgi:ATP-binding cassette subfamily G (WHITE) protein 2